jgi:rhodanese-related sulfurtransferase
VGFLLGRWRGLGAGKFPTIKPFHYSEEVKFAHASKEFLQYGQTSHSPDLQPVHFESGFLKSVGENAFEMSTADPNYIAVYAGKLEDRGLEKLLTLESTHVKALTGSGPLTKLRRKYLFRKAGTSNALNVDTLECHFAMAPDSELLPHLTSKLFRLPPELHIDGQQAHERLSDYDLVIDVREPEEYADGHVLGAINWPIGSIIREAGNADSDIRRGLSNRRKVLVYCKAGYRSRMAIDELATSIPHGESPEFVTLDQGYTGFAAGK